MLQGWGDERSVSLFRIELKMLISISKALNRLWLASFTVVVISYSAAAFDLQYEADPEAFPWEP